MNIKIIALGKIKEKFLKDGIEEFLKRLRPYAGVEIIELSPVEIKDENLISKALDDEAEKILSYIKQQSFVITLEIQGKMLSSEEFAAKINELSNQGIGELIFVIGSSCGLSPKGKFQIKHVKDDFSASICETFTGRTNLPCIQNP